MKEEEEELLNGCIADLKNGALKPCAARGKFGWRLIMAATAASACWQTRDCHKPIPRMMEDALSRSVSGCR